MKKLGSLEVVVMACMILVPTYLSWKLPRASAQNGSAIDAIYFNAWIKKMNQTFELDCTAGLFAQFQT